MRNLIGAIAMATLIGSGLAGLPAAEAAGHPRTVEFTGTSTFDFGSGGCSFAHQVFDATLTTKRGATLHIEGCADIVDGVTFPFSGSFTVSSAGRHSISGTVAGAVVTVSTGSCTTGAPAGLDFELTQVRSDGQQRDPIALDGIWCSLGTPGVPNDISGTLSGELPPILR